MRLLRPLSAAPGPLVEISLDGVLFDDLTFFGPNKLNSRRTMMVWELEARRDRKHLRQMEVDRQFRQIYEQVLATHTA